MMRLLAVTFACLALVQGDLSSYRPPEIDEFPFQVTVKDLQRNISLCSGVLVAPKAVLTPASCVKPDGLVKVSAGSIFSSRQNVTRTFTDVIVRPGHNIAIIKVCDKFPETPLIRPAKVPVYGTELVKKGELSGWNRLDPDDCLKVMDDYFVWKKCKSTFNVSKVLSPDAFCGDYTPGLERGSLVTRDGVIYGLLSVTYPSKKMQEFVEVSVHAEWIKEKLVGDVTWHGQDRNRAAVPSTLGAGILVLALLL